MKKLFLLLLLIPLNLYAGELVWEKTAGPPGGNFHIVRVNPDDSNFIYAASSSGLFISQNAAESWQLSKIHGYLVGREVYIRAIEFDRTNSIVYLGGEFGILRSWDKGITWERALEGKSITAIGIAPDAIYVAAAISDNKTKIYKSTDSCFNWADITGNFQAESITNIVVIDAGDIYMGGGAGMNRAGHLYRSKDGGNRWQVVDLGQDKETFVSIIKINPKDNSHIIIGLGDSFNRGRENLWELLFESRDRGNTWAPVKDKRLEGLEPSPLIHKIIYYLSIINEQTPSPILQNWNNVRGFGKVEPSYVEIDPNNPVVLYEALIGQGIAKSKDSGKIWELANSGLINTTIDNIVIHPHDPNVIYVAGGEGSGTYKSTDRGDHWTILNPGGIDHPWVDELVINPKDPSILYQIADTGIIYKTEDSGNTWKEINNDFMFSSILALETSPVFPDTVYAMNNGYGLFKTDNAGGDWRYLLNSPDYSYDIEIDPDNPNIIYSGHTRKVFEESSKLYKSENGGEDWKAVLDIPESKGVRSVKVDPKNTNRVIVGSVGKHGEIYETADKGKAWQKINKEFTFTSIHSMAVSDGAVYAGTWGGGIYKTTDEGYSWIALSGSPLYASCISIDTKNPNTIYAASGVKPEIYKSKDKGKTWELLYDAGSKYSRIIALAVSPSENETIYISALKKDVYTSPHQLASDGDSYVEEKFATSLASWCGDTSGLPLKENFFQGSLFKIENGIPTDISANLSRGVVSIAISPDNPKIIYVSTEIFGLYKTYSGGDTWEKLKGLPDREVLDILIDRKNPDTIYAGTLIQGLTHFGQKPAFGYPVDLEYPSGICGLYKSIDAGKTWQNINDDRVGETGIRSIAQHPLKGLIYVVTQSGIYRVRDNIWEPQEMPHSKDCGKLLFLGEKPYIGSFGGGVCSGIIDTENNIHWRGANGPVIHVSDIQIHIDPLDSKIVYASSYPGGMFKSTDSGKTWHEKNTGLFCTVIDPNRQVYYNFDIDQTNPNRLYMALYGVGVFRSDNGGDSWETINGKNGELAEKPLSQIKISQKNPSEIFVTSPDGVYYTNTAGQLWKKINNGLKNTDMFSLALGNDGKAYAGNRGYGVYVYNRDTNEWTRTRDVTNFGVYWWVWDRPLYLYNALLINPINPDIMYFGTFPTGFYRTIDGGQTWIESNLNFTIDGAFSLVFHPYNTDIIYAGTYNGVSKSTDSGMSWEKIDKGMPPEQWVFTVAIDYTNPQIIYASSKNGKNKGNGEEGFHGMVMKSENGGESWFPIMNGMDKNNEFYSLVIHPKNPNILFVSTQHDGVFMSKNKGESWEAVNKGLTNLNGGVVNNVANNMRLDCEGRFLYLGTRGSGVFRLDLKNLK